MAERHLEAERLLLVGLLDQAELLYRRAIENDPRDAIAMTGLARVALDRGDDRAAYEHARRAVEADPQNAMALRLEARLSEILVTRGEAVERPAAVRPVGHASPATSARGRGLLRRLRGR